ATSEDGSFGLGVSELLAEPVLHPLAADAMRTMLIRRSNFRSALFIIHLEEAAGFAIPGKPEALARAPLLALRAVVYVRLLLAFALATGGHMNISIRRRRYVRMMIVLEIRRVRLRIIMSGMIVVVVMATLGASVFAGVVVLSGVVIMATISRMPTVPIILLGQIAIAQAIIPVAAWIVVARAAVVAIAVSDAVIPILVPAT